MAVDSAAPLAVFPYELVHSLCWTFHSGRTRALGVTTARIHRRALLQDLRSLASNGGHLSLPFLHTNSSTLILRYWAALRTPVITTSSLLHFSYCPWIETRPTGPHEQPGRSRFAPDQQGTSACTPGLMGPSIHDTIA